MFFLRVFLANCVHVVCQVLCVDFKTLELPDKEVHFVPREGDVAEEGGVRIDGLLRDVDHTEPSVQVGLLDDVDVVVDATAVVFYERRSVGACCFSDHVLSWRKRSFQQQKELVDQEVDFVVVDEDESFLPGAFFEFSVLTNL